MAAHWWLLVPSRPVFRLMCSGKPAQCPKACGSRTKACHPIAGAANRLLQTTGGIGRRRVLKAVLPAIAKSKTAPPNRV